MPTGYLTGNFHTENILRFAADVDKPTQDALLKAAAAAETRGWKTSEEKNGWYKEQLVKNGMNVDRGSPQLIADLKNIGTTMTDEWANQTGSEGRAVVDAYRK